MGLRLGSPQLTSRSWDRAIQAGCILGSLRGDRGSKGEMKEQGLPLPLCPVAFGAMLTFSPGHSLDGDSGPSKKPISPPSWMFIASWLQYYHLWSS